MMFFYGLIHEFIKPIYAVVQRDLIKFSRQKGRVLSSLVRPLIWLVVIGAGFNSIVTTDGNDYFEFWYLVF